MAGREAASGYLGSSSMKMKRKEVDEVSDDFSDFSLSAPARKMRRLFMDGDLPPIMEEEEAAGAGSVGWVDCRQHKVQIEELTPESSSLPSSSSTNDERAIVLFKPVNNFHLFRSPQNNFSVSLDSNFISGFKNQFIWPNQSGEVKLPEDDEAFASEKARNNNSMAVVPWVPSQAQPGSVQAMMDSSSVSRTEGVVESMEDEEMGEATMDIEVENNNFSDSVGLGQGQGSQPFGFGGIRAGNDGLPQWQQQHCLIPQIPQNANPTPITWLR